MHSGNIYLCRNLFLSVRVLHSCIYYYQSSATVSATVLLPGTRYWYLVHTAVQHTQYFIRELFNLKVPVL